MSEYKIFHEHVVPQILGTHLIAISSERRLRAIKEGGSNNKQPCQQIYLLLKYFI